MRDKFIVINTAVITTALAALIGFGLHLGSLSDRANITLKKAKVEACRTIVADTDRTLCLKLVG